MKDFSLEKFDIFIQAGQSNSEGIGYGPVEDPYIPSEQVWFMNRDGTLSMAAEKVTKNEIQSTFAFAFIREYLKAGLLQEGRKVLILRAAVSGTGFLDHHWGLQDDHYLCMMNMIREALELNSENCLKGLLWHQGEQDSTMRASYDTHYNNLFGLLNSVRETFNVPDLPFIAGDFVQHFKSSNIEGSTPVVSAIKDVCNHYEYGAFVESDRLLSNAQELGRLTPIDGDLWITDIYHFSRKSCYELGKRYWKAYTNIIKR